MELYRAIVMISQVEHYCNTLSHINMKYSGDETADSAVNDPLLKQREERENLL